jgi:hypothetical protein
VGSGKGSGMGMGGSDQSRKGRTFGAYGRAVLASVPAESLLLSHTDLNWNSVRYLQSCERLRPDVTHLNFQLIPYPWFPRQHRLGAHAGAVFPPMPAGVSTNRMDDGNTQLVLAVMRANLQSGRFPGGIYMDMQVMVQSASKC